LYSEDRIRRILFITNPFLFLGDSPMAEQEWTVLIYLAGDNNLSEECVFALKEMKKVGTRDPGKIDPYFNLYIEFDPAGRGNTTRRFAITTPGGDGQLPRDEDPRPSSSVAPRGETPTSKETIVKFLIDGIKKFPARHYMVILSGHAAGVDEGFLLRDEERPLSLIPTALSMEELKAIFMDSNLQSALGSEKIDILGLDACMMSVTEVCYQLRESAALKVLDYFIGSEGFSLNAGWPYAENSRNLRGPEDLAPEDLAKEIAGAYINFYQDYFLGGLSVDLSIIRIGAIKTLKDKIQVLATELYNLLPKVKPKEIYDKQEQIPWSPYLSALVLAHWEAQSYNGEQCVDLSDFCNRLLCHLDRTEKEIGVQPTWKALKEACKAITHFIEETGEIILRSCYAGAAFQYSTGISLYFPWSNTNLAPNYGNLDFPRDSGWFKFVDQYVIDTQRPPRVDGAGPRDVNRSTPPYSKGPEGRVFSMRNPPTKFIEYSCDPGSSRGNASYEPPSDRK
jgi:hypothetical protein